MDFYQGQIQGFMLRTRSTFQSKLFDGTIATYNWEVRGRGGNLLPHPLPRPPRPLPAVTGPLVHWLLIIPLLPLLGLSLAPRLSWFWRHWLTGSSSHLPLGPVIILGADPGLHYREPMADGNQSGEISWVTNNSWLLLARTAELPHCFSSVCK